VRSFARRFLDSGEPLDVLVNNAGIMACPLMRTKDGFEMQLGVNHLGHFALTLELLPRLSDPSRSSRVVTVSSAAHLAGSMNFNDLNSQRGYQRWVAYSQSKLANVLMTYELARRTPNTARLTANTLHPGVVATDLARFLLPSESEMPWAAKAAAGLMRNFLKTPEQGAQTSICLTSSPDVEGLTSRYFSDCKPVPSSPVSYDPDVARRLWEMSMELTESPAPVSSAAA